MKSKTQFCANKHTHSIGLGSPWSIFGEVVKTRLLHSRDGTYTWCWLATEASNLSSKNVIRKCVFLNMVTRCKS